MTRARHRKTWVAGIILMAVVGVTIRGQCADSSSTNANNGPDPLLDLFIKKGFVTEQEAEQVQAEAQFNRTNQFANVTPPSSQWKITKGIQKVELFGDVRLRYEDRYAGDSAGNSIDLQRFRYSVRVGLRGEAFDNFYYGLRLETGANPRSSFVTLGTSTSGVYQGPFGKSNAGINIGQAYLGWRPWDWVDVTMGKMPNPLYTRSMVWSGNINPEGAAEHFKYNVGPADFFATFGQFLYADFNPDSASPGLGIGFLPGGSGPGSGQQTDKIFMFAWQGGFNYHIATNTSAKIAATIYNYTGLQRSFSGSTALSPYFGDPYVGEGAYWLQGGTNTLNAFAPGASGYNPGQTFGGGVPNASPAGYGSVSYPFNQVGLNHLLILELPGEFDFKINTLDARLFGDVAYNLQGAQRAEDAANAYSTILGQNVPPNGNATPHPFPAQTSDVKAYQVGFDIGSPDSLDLVNGATSRKNAWELRAYWQHIEQYSLDPNLIDTDFFEGQENLQGVYAALAYSFTDNFIATFRYGHASRINDLLGTGGSGQDIPQINPIDNYNIYQMDLTFRF
jgi:hypothetical protein